MAGTLGVGATGDPIGGFLVGEGFSMGDSRFNVPGEPYPFTGEPASSADVWWGSTAC